MLAGSAAVRPSRECGSWRAAWRTCYAAPGGPMTHIRSFRSGLIFRDSRCGGLCSMAISMRFSTSHSCSELATPSRMCSVVCGHAFWNRATKGGMRMRPAAGGTPSVIRPLAGERSSLIFLAGLMNEMDDRLRPFEQQRAGDAEPHAAAVAGEQRNAELVLELLDLPAQGRLRQTQLLRRAADAAGARHPHEVAQFFQFHDALICSYTFAA